MSLQVASSLLGKLQFHQRRHQVRDGHLLAHQPQHQRQLQTEQAAAEYSHKALVAQETADRLHVLQSAQGEYAFEVEPAHGWDERTRAGGQHQAVVGERRSVIQCHLARLTVNRRDGLAEPGVDAVLGVPSRRLDIEIGQILGSQLDHQLDAVVITVRFIADDGDGIPFRILKQQLLNQFAASHAAADHHQFLFRAAHAFSPAVVFDLPAMR